MLMLPLIYFVDNALIDRQCKAEYVYEGKKGFEINDAWAGMVFFHKTLLAGILIKGLYSVSREERWVIVQVSSLS